MTLHEQEVASFLQSLGAFMNNSLGHYSGWKNPTTHRVRSLDFQIRLLHLHNGSCPQATFQNRLHYPTMLSNLRASSHITSICPTFSYIAPRKLESQLQVYISFPYATRLQRPTRHYMDPPCVTLSDMGFPCQEGASSSLYMVSMSRDLPRGVPLIFTYYVSYAEPATHDFTCKWEHFYRYMVSPYACRLLHQLVSLHPRFTYSIM